MHNVDMKEIEVGKTEGPKRQNTSTIRFKQLIAFKHLIEKVTIVVNNHLEKKCFAPSM